MSELTAAMLIIGNEILSGRTQDKNLGTIAHIMTESGIALSEARVIPDDEARIIEAVKEFSAKYTYVFTSGGIGPTHDDITSASVAKAFGVPLERNPEAYARLKAHYDGGDKELNEARARMADVPVGARLINNPVSGAPGFVIQNVFVMAGVPTILRAMMEHVKTMLEGGKKFESHSISTNIPEGDLAVRLTTIQDEFPSVDVGSYPFMKGGVLGTSIVVRGNDIDMLARAAAQVRHLVEHMGGETFDLGSSNTW